MPDLCTFSVGDSLYGLPILAVEEIFRPVPITNLPGSDKRVSGIINLRGNSAACLNLRHCLESKERDTPPNPSKQRMILLEPTEDLLEEALDSGIQTFEEPIVILADEVHQIIHCRDADQHPPPAHLTNGYVVGIYPHEDGWLTQLDISAIVANILSNGAA